MKAAVLHALGQTPHCESFPDPTPQAGEVLVEVTAAALNAIDRMIAAGTHYSKPERLPVVCGINGAGKLPDGRHVLFGGVRAPYGSMAQYACVDPNKTFVLPVGSDDALAAAAFNPGLSALLTLEWRGKLAPGERVLILGATGVTGQLAVQFARRMGAGRIIVAGRNRRVLAQLRELGADATIEIDRPDSQLEAAFRAEAGEGGYDLIVDYLWGHPTEVLLRALTNHDLNTHGKRIRLIEVGEMAGSHISLPGGVLRSTGLEILGNGTGNAPGPELLAGATAELLGALARGELRLDIAPVGLAEVAEHWHADQAGRRTVFIP
jgi:NADPH:quinone reductase-like Zn-dependent oxidoreductase